MNTRRLQVKLYPEVLRWARERAGLSVEDLAKKAQVRTERAREWEDSGNISIAQADRLARVTHTPLGFLFLAEPPEDGLPIADFRTVGDQPLRRPSPDLLETVYQMQRRQTWLRGELIEDEISPLPFVGAYTTADSPEVVAQATRLALKVERDWAAGESTWTEALHSLRQRMEEAGVLVVINGIVGNNTYRQLDLDEFRGFALMDEYAPLIFVNNADYKSAQMFTLVHEFAHVLIGEDGVSTFEEMHPVPHGIEIFCNRVAAEFLIPGELLHNYWTKISESIDPYQAVARRFKVSVLVAARRALDLQLIDRPSFLAFYHEYLSREMLARESGSDGGNFWNNQNTRLGRRFGAAVVRAVKKGRLQYREAYALTGLAGASFENLALEMDIRL